MYTIIMHSNDFAGLILREPLTPFFSQTPPAFFKSPVHAKPSVPISKSRYVNI